ncbi:MAG: hypothetical protein F6K50_24335 [Moorea sp. SIO3I7]|uniref:hypothetical protein n=1 Tax=Moorena sp. SIO3I8 TaxID=2607833 RepID=UPI0013BED8F5|nr:hypothetical protein [Moorena sp. SIO3I8]NEN98526.1 hypothetical protein [Moorena sp. SIO3I7]NEO04126.1 hypothetical protein [Moorena sp. SIO3I8]
MLAVRCQLSTDPTSDASGEQPNNLGQKATRSRSTFNLQPANLQPSPFNLQPANLQPSTRQPSTFNLPTFNLQPWPKATLREQPD